MATAICAAALWSGQGRAQTAADRTRICQDDDNPSQTVALDARRFSSAIAVHNCWSADTTNASQYYLNDLYSRWILEEVPRGDLTLSRDYAAERRSPLARMLWGKSRGAVMSVKIRMRDPDVEFTVPLMSLDYSGKSGEGETFATAYTSSEMGLPDFRLSPNTSVSVEAMARLTNDVDVQSTGIVLGALKDSLAVVSPGGSLLTTVNRDQVQRVATAYDSALSKLLSSSVTESAVVGRLASEWYPTSSILISVDVPDEIRTDAARKRPAGTPRRVWFRLTMACPRISIFDTTNVCPTGVNGGPNMRILINSPYYQKGGTADHAVGRPGRVSPVYAQFVHDLSERVNANQVLNFRVGPARTIRQYLTEQEWFIGLSKKMVQPKPAVNATIGSLPEDQLAAAQDGRFKTAAGANRSGSHDQDVGDALSSASQFCEAVVEKLFSSGLSLLDSRVGLWAVASSMPDFAPSRQVFAKSTGCIANLPDEGRGVWSFAPTDSAS